MSNTIYATYTNPERADRAFVELLERGANLLDLVIATQNTYQVKNGFDDGRLDVPESARLEYDTAISTTTPPTLDDAPVTRNPFNDSPGGIRLMDNLRYEGDLAACLRLLGFPEAVSEHIEDLVVGGGALLILRVPSGPVEELQAWEAIERHGGSVVAPIRDNPYLG